MSLSNGVASSSGLALPLRLPLVVGAAPVSTGLALVQQCIDGIPLDLRVGRMPGIRPWEVVAEVAATCHQIEFAPLQSILPPCKSRREFAESTLAPLDELDIPEGPDASAWALAHLPKDIPPVLLHGDLLGQNIIISLEPDVPVGVIDWDHAVIGDPAFDLAIVTRGARKPFQIESGLQKLLDASNEHTDAGLTPTNVHLYELLLLAGFYMQAAEKDGPDSPRAEQEQGDPKGDHIFADVMQQCRAESWKATYREAGARFGIQSQD
ncbi:phosphotransferase [Myxococcota bacterium]